MPTSGAPGKARYATKAAIERAIAATRAAGLDISGVELAADGTIRILTGRDPSSAAASAYDRWKAGRESPESAFDR